METRLGPLERILKGANREEEEEEEEEKSEGEKEEPG